jgi:hypothetical protein
MGDDFANFSDGSKCGTRVLVALARRDQFFSEREELDKGKEVEGGRI